MLEEKKKLILSLMMKEIDYSIFIDDYNNLFDGLDVCRDLKIARNLKDSDAVDLFLYLGTVISYKYSCVNLLNNLIIDTWHTKHEELARLLSIYKDNTSVDYLYKAALLNLEYLEYDEDHVLADKCIRALAKINSAESIEKLEVLSKSKNQAISKSANKQLERIKG